MSLLFTIVHIVTGVLIVIVVLLQSGKGAEISASFGGSSQTVFGSSGGANFFVKLTSVMAVIFTCTSLGLTIMGSQSKKSLFEGMPVPAKQQAPAAPQQQAAPEQGAAQPQQAAPTGATPPAANTAPKTDAAAPAAPADKK